MISRLINLYIKSIFQTPWKIQVLLSFSLMLATIIHIPWWVNIVALVFTSYKLILLNKKISHKINYVIIALTIITTIYFLIQKYNTLLSIEAGLSFLVILQALKFYEIKDQRGHFIHLCVILIAVSGLNIFSSTLPYSLYMLSVVPLVFYTFMLHEKYYHGNFTVKFKIKGKSLIYPLLLTPLLVLLFLLIPRYEGGLNLKSRKIAESSFDADVKPGLFSEVILSESVAFRVRFLKGKMPPSDMRYWIGSTLEITDGYHWSPNKYQKDTFFTSQKTKLSNIPFIYEISTNFIINEYLLTLDNPQEKPIISMNFRTLGDKTFKLYRHHTKKLVYTVKSAPQNSYDKTYLKFNTLLPKKQIGEKVYKLAKSLKEDQPQNTIKNILLYFKKNNFYYTTSPGITNKLEEFLFETKKGYCSHFASALAIMARINKIPARVVAGFQGGSYNEYGDYYILKQKDAHAWTEIWLKDKGWSRYDPVAWISPQRIQLGGQDYFALSEEDRDNPSINSSNISILKKWGLYWDYLNNNWEKFIRSYDLEAQIKLAKKLGFALKTLYSIAFILPFLTLLLYYLLKLIKTKHKNNELTQIRDFRRICDKLESMGIKKEKSTGVGEFINIIQSHEKLSIKQKQMISEYFNNYILYRYSTKINNSKLTTTHSSLLKILKKSN